MVEIETAVLVALPEAQDAVGATRDRLDIAAAWGVPPHVTVLYPFVAAELIDDEVRARLAEAVGSVPAFDAVLSRIGWFGDDVFWLMPEPEESFRALIRAVCNRFPDLLPYGGEHADVVPHLTVGRGAPIEVLRVAAAAVQPRLPVRARVSAVSLMAGSERPGSWHTLTELPLAG